MREFYTIGKVGISWNGVGWYPAGEVCHKQAPRVMRTYADVSKISSGSQYGNQGLGAYLQRTAKC